VACEFHEIWNKLLEHWPLFLVYRNVTFFYELKASRYQGRDRHSNLIDIPILPLPPSIAHIIINKKRKKYIQELGEHRPNPVCVLTSV
jgi:hypothetical protein